MNRQLHSLEVFQAAMKAFEQFGEPWVLDLGLVDAIEGRLMTKCDDVGRMIFTQSEVLLDSALGLGAIPTEFLP